MASSKIMDQNTLQPKKLRNTPVTILTEILKEKAKLDKDLVRKHNAILRSFLQTFIPEMKKRDDLFDSLYQCIYFTGSYYSNLRISEPNEYDLNLMLKLPFKEKNISVEYQPQVPSYVKYRIKDESVMIGQNGLNMLFKNKFLIPDEVRSWIQSVVDKALDTYQRPRKLAQVKPGSSSGPSRAITLVKKDGTKIDIDLVPVIEYSMNLEPPGIDSNVYAEFSRNLKVPKVRSSKTRPKCNIFAFQGVNPRLENVPLQGQLKPEAGNLQDHMSNQYSNLMGTCPQNKNKGLSTRQTQVQKSVGRKVRARSNQPAAGGTSSQNCNNAPKKRARHRFPARCFLVPKPYKPSKQAPVNDTERACLWRAHYPKAEENVIHDLGCVKSVIKLLKLLRDKEDWKILASYYLKTVVMWMIIENPEKESWRMDHLGVKFLEALKNLQNCVERRQIRYFFSPKYNLLEKLNEDEAKIIQNRLGIIIRDIERDNENLWDIFGCPPTFTLVKD